LSKINLLRDERELLLLEKEENDVFGQELLTRLEEVASASEVDRVFKYLLEVEQITKLTVGLTMRMGRLNKVARGNVKVSKSANGRNGNLNLS